MLCLERELSLECEMVLLIANFLSRIVNKFNMRLRATNVARPSNETQSISTFAVESASIQSILIGPLVAESASVQSILLHSSDRQSDRNREQANKAIRLDGTLPTPSSPAATPNSARPPPPLLLPAPLALERSGAEHHSELVA
jgi:hypothetical protein